MKSKHWSLKLLLAFALFQNSAFALSEDISRQDSLDTLGSAPTSIPKVITDEVLRQHVDQFIKRLRGKAKEAAANHPEFKEQVFRYLKFLAPKDEETIKSLRSVFASSSMQFLNCQPEEWECIEKYPTIPIANPSRDDISPTLGTPISVNEPLRLEYFLTQRWAQKFRHQESHEATVAEIFGRKIRENAKNGLYMALYGIDEADGTMKPVYDAIAEAIRSKVDVRAVVDVTAEGDPNSFFRSYDVVFKGQGHPEIIDYKLSDMDFSYVKPADPEKWAWGRPRWMHEIQNIDLKVFGKDNNEVKTIYGSQATEARDALWIARERGGDTAIRLAFQYKDTPRLVNLLNQGITNNSLARARLEYPMSGIMHNKFAVMRNGPQWSVWSGTTNVADTCMGSEDNSNIAVLIKNNVVAQAFYQEFREMFRFDSTNEKLKKNVPTLLTGRFHNEKRVNTQRYFKFNDGTELRLHFSPTDDGEHRAILPFIHSSKKGDTLRISMFGSGGLEAVRALQAAQARGVIIKMVLDNVTGSGNYSWIKHAQGNLFDENPYAGKTSEALVPMDIRLNAWPGLNHHKTATLTNAQGKVEQMIIGSQNWSQQGNNENDENMMTFRRRGGSLEVGEAFNKQFEESMLPLSNRLIKKSASSDLEKLPLESSGLTQ